jgi:hypothetical protein
MRCLGRVATGTIKRHPQAQPPGAGMALTATVSIPQRLELVLTTTVSTAICDDVSKAVLGYSRRPSVVCCSLLLSACTMGPVQRHDVNFNAYSLIFLVLAIGLVVAAAKADYWPGRLFFSAACLGNFICWLDINSAAIGYWLPRLALAISRLSL